MLVSPVNGLYYAPFLRDEPSGPQDNFYAALTTTALGMSAPIHPGVETSKFFRREALAASPVQGRYWLAVLAGPGAPMPTKVEDTAAILRLVTRDGWFRDSANDDTFLASKISTTLGALEFLHLTGGEEQLRSLSATRRWMEKLARDPQPLAQAADVARALRLLSGDTPTERRSLQQEPPASGLATVSSEERLRALDDMFAYCQLQSARGLKVDVPSEDWTRLLKDNVDTVDHQSLYKLVFVLSTAGRLDQVAALVKARLDRDRLPDGTVRDEGSYTGSAEATFFGLILRKMAGESTIDPGLESSLARLGKDPQVTENDYVDLIYRSSLALSKGSPAAPADAALTSLCAPGRALPDPVTIDSAQQWARASMACATLGVPVLQPALTRWKSSDPQGAIAAAGMVNAFADVGLDAAAAPWRQEDLSKWVKDPERLTNTYAYADVVRAYVILGGDPSVTRDAGRVFRGRRSCRDLPSLYKADATLGCDLKATWSVWKLEAGADKDGASRQITRMSNP